MHTHVHIKHTQKDDFSLGTKFSLFRFIGSRFKRERILEAKRKSPEEIRKTYQGCQPPESVSDHFDIEV